MASGRCICGAVSFEVNGPMRDVVLCHCTECRRWAGHAWPATSAKFDELEFSEERGLRGVDSPDSEYDARRGLCSECGSLLFLQDPRGRTGGIPARCPAPPPGVRAGEQNLG